METIKKTISLEQYKSRFNHKTPYIDSKTYITSVTENNWGKIPCDYFFNTLDECAFSKIKEKLPLVSGIDLASNEENIIINDNCFRYKTMIYWYNWLINYGKNCKYYKLCKRNTDYIWGELNGEVEYGDFFINDYNLGVEIITSVSYIPIDYEKYAIGTIIEVNEDADTLKQIFRNEGDNIRYELEVLKFIKEHFNNNNFHVNLSIPYIDIPVHLTQKIDNLGLLTSTAKEWNRHKTYMIDDVVIYNNNTYILKNGDTYGFVEVSGGLYETFVNNIENENTESIYYNFIKVDKLPTNLTQKEIVYNIDNGKKNIYYLKNEGYYQIYLPYISHKAKIDDKTGEFIFDKNFWKLNSGNYDSFNVDESGIILEGDMSGEMFNTKYIRTTSDSKLTTLRRFKKSIDEDGNILPFILDAYKSTDTELPYTTGIYNVYMGTNDTFRGDVMTNISIKAENDDQYLDITYFGSGQTGIYTQFYKNVDEKIDSVINLPHSIILNNIESANTILYKWVEISKSDEGDKIIEIVDSLPNAEEKYFNLCYQTTSYTENTIYYVVHKCVKDKILVTYSATTNNSIYITPSMLMMGSSGLISTKGIINFSYIKDCFLIYNDKDITLKNYDYQTGLMYNESYNYEISVAAINLTHDKNTEVRAGITRSYKLYDYEPEESDEISGTIQNVDTENYKNVGNIYSVIDYRGNIVGYKRLLSEYNFIDIDFDSQIYEVSSTDVENLKKNTILSTIDYTLENITNDDFQKDYVIKNEYTIGMEDDIENVDINIERGLSASFEKHHILCEIKSMRDLENYRNNFFKI